jgi:hypothetical protein
MNMWWECSECGGHVERARAPAVCPECGTAGVIFVHADANDLVAGDSDGDGFRATWFRAGLDRADAGDHFTA